MSDHGLEDDLFGASDNEAPPQPPSPIASSSRGSPKPSGTATPAKQEDEGVADLVCLSTCIHQDTKLTASSGKTKMITHLPHLHELEQLLHLIHLSLIHLDRGLKPRIR